jgi:hypothetical protein
MLAILMIFINILFSAVGCDLNDPDKDVKRLFPESDGYKTTYRSIQREGGALLLSKIESQLGDKFTGLYETIDNPYTLYEITQNRQTIGYIHGVNQKGKYGGLQVFLALDKNGVIVGVYFQKLSSKYGKQFRNDDFTSLFKGLMLKDFQSFDVITGIGSGKVSKINNPAPNDDPDFLYIMRGIKKNLVLMAQFAISERIGD